MHPPVQTEFEFIQIQGFLVVHHGLRTAGAHAWIGPGAEQKSIFVRGIMSFLINHGPPV